MTYKEQIHAVLWFMYNETKCFATSNTCHIPYNTMLMIKTKTLIRLQRIILKYIRKNFLRRKSNE